MFYTAYEYMIYILELKCVLIYIFFLNLTYLFHSLASYQSAILVKNLIFVMYQKRNFKNLNNEIKSEK